MAFETLRIERAGPTELTAAADLARQVYATGPIAHAFSDPAATLARWKWHSRTPEEGSAAWVALREGKVVGHIGMIPATIVGPWGSARAAWVRDIMVAPDARGSGLGSRLIEAALDASGGLLLLGGLNPAVRRMYMKLGYRDMGSIPSFVRPVRGDVLLERMGAPRVVAVLGHSVARVWSSSVSAYRRQRVEVRPLERFDERFDEWWSRIEPSLGCVVRRTSATMRWRYAEHPVHHYTVLAAWHGDALRGISVVRTGATRGLRSGHVVEILAGSDDVDAALGLVDASTQLLLGDDPVLLRCSTTSPLARRALVRSGFLPAPSPFRWMIATAAGHQVALDECARWTVTGGDSDLDAI